MSLMLFVAIDQEGVCALSHSGLEGLSGEHDDAGLQDVQRGPARVRRAGGPVVKPWWRSASAADAGGLDGGDQKR